MSFFKLPHIWDESIHHSLPFFKRYVLTRFCWCVFREKVFLSPLAYIDVTVLCYDVLSQREDSCYQVAWDISIPRGWRGKKINRIKVQQKTNTSKDVIYCSLQQPKKLGDANFRSVCILLSVFVPAWRCHTSLYTSSKCDPRRCWTIQ